MLPPLADHARTELALAGHGRRHPAHTAVLIALVAAFDSIDHPDGEIAAAQQLCALLNRGTLSPLTSDPAEWADKTDQHDGPLWRNTRNPQAFSPDAGRTYWLLTDTAGDDGNRPIYVSAPPRLTEGVAEL